MRGVRRATLAVSAGFLAVVAAVFLAMGVIPGLFGLAGCALFLIVALAIERWRYKPVLSAPPGPEWRANGEQFMDPETGRKVTVYEDPATGKRAYVAL